MMRHRDDAYCRSLPSPPSETATAVHPGAVVSNDIDRGGEDREKEAPLHDKPVILIGLSSSPGNDELTRLAIMLSGALAGNDPLRLRGAIDELERSQEAGLVGEEGDDDNVGEAGGGAPIDDGDAADRPRGEEEGTVVGISCRASPGS